MVLVKFGKNANDFCKLKNLAKISNVWNCIYFLLKIKLLLKEWFFMSKIVKKLGLAIGLIAFAFAIFVVINTPFFSIYGLSKTLNISADDFETICCDNYFGRFVKCEIDGDYEAVVGGQAEATLKLKLFNLITLRTFNINTQDTDLYVGGDIVGFSLNGDGVVVISMSNVETCNGSFDTLQDSDIQKGDIIKKINGQTVGSVADICKIINKKENLNKTLEVEIKREDETIITTITPALDVNSKLYKLGLWVKDDASGIGTLTYIKKDDGRFGALGHAICDTDTKTPFDIDSGEMYKCTVIGLKKGTKGHAGELKGLFLQGKNNLGEVDTNCDYGVFGTINDSSDILQNKEILKAGGRMYAKPGKAYIRTAIDGKDYKDYEIEIVKTNYQSTKNEKSMVIRVTDKELLQKTGGIIQGMSGSPIIQNGRVVGAVTHVFINDPSKGFGIYLDWMINQ
jgi:stage IV sporulation protein B